MMRRAVYPGTFDPVHYGHLDLMARGAALFDELVVAVYDHATPTKSVLFSVDERIQMIRESLGPRDNIVVQPFSGLLVDFAREINAKIIIRGLRVFSDFEFEFRSALANKRLAPEIDTISLMTSEEHTFLSGTTVREIAALGGDVSSMVPKNVATALYAQFYGDSENGYQPPAPLRD
ncbi:MAG: pantetheine-phosphate adenylyltransferase [Candidatus Promineifilaceae bacterium]